MGHVFVSFSSRDVKMARAICGAIEDRGYPCWISDRDVRPGRNYQDEIVDAIGSASVFVLVFSQNSNNSSEIKKELSLASRSNLLVVPVRIEDIVPTGALQYELSTRQWIDIFEDWERAVGRIVDQIRSIAPLDESQTAAVAATRKPFAVRRRPVSYLLSSALVLVGILAAGWWFITPSIAALDYPDADPEKPETRVNSFTIKIVMGGVVQGRAWTRVTSDRWKESYLDENGADVGTTVTLNVVKRMILFDCSGTVVVEVGQPRKFAFIPDKGCEGMPFRISHSSDTWGVASHLEDVR